MTSRLPDAEALRRRACVAAGVTDRERWEDAASYELFWSDRSVAAARLCRPEQWVCDIGCGMQGLRALLPPGCTYMPADLRPWDAAVEVCDLNAGILPERHLVRCDVVTLLGVMEYVFDPLRLLIALGRWAETMVLSYNCVELADVDRAGFGWVNALTSETVVARLRQAGFRPDTLERFGSMEILVRASNTSFGKLRRARRHLARMMYAPPHRSGPSS